MLKNRHGSQCSKLQSEFLLEPKVLPYQIQPPGTEEQWEHALESMAYIMPRWELPVEHASGVGTCH